MRIFIVILISILTIILFAITVIIHKTAVPSWRPRSRFAHIINTNTKTTTNTNTDTHRKYTHITTRYKQFPGGDQNQKPLLYIGGIFPISASTKFTAPELVPGEIFINPGPNQSQETLPFTKLTKSIIIFEAPKSLLPGLKHYHNHHPQKCNNQNFIYNPHYSPSCNDGDERDQQ